MKVKRFFYVTSHRCRAIHIQYSRYHSEDLTACGRQIIPKVWWWTRLPRLKPICTQCETARGA